MAYIEYDTIGYDYDDCDWETGEPRKKEITVYLKDTVLIWNAAANRYMFKDNEEELHCGNTFEILASTEPDVYVPVRIESGKDGYYLIADKVTIYANNGRLDGKAVRRYVSYWEYRNAMRDAQ